MYDVAIMQPTYLPWAGYFNLMGSVRHFVFLDDVEYSKSSWQTRNRLNVAGDPHWISLPVSHKAAQRICDVRIRREAQWPRKHIQQLQSVYGKAPFSKDLEPISRLMQESRADTLSQLNIELISFIAKKLKLECTLQNSSDIATSQLRSQRLLDIIQHFEGKTYLSPVGSKEYLEADGVLYSSGVDVVYQSYDPQPYPQLRTEGWVSHMSIVDVIANIGWDATEKNVKGY